MAEIAAPRKTEYTLITVNDTPERAYTVVGKIAEALRPRYVIKHIGNVESPDEVRSKIKEVQPDLLFCASMWTQEQSSAAFEAARAEKPDIKTYAIPHGLQVAHGPNAVVEHMVEVIPGILEG